MWTSMRTSCVHAASLEECGVAVLCGVADGEVPLPRHHHRQEGRRVQQHRLKKEEEGMDYVCGATCIVQLCM